MQPPGSTRWFLGIGREAPPPSGPEDADFKATMLTEARDCTFRFRVNLWSWLTGRNGFDWEGFERLLEESEFRSFASTEEAMHSLGWAGRLPERNKVRHMAGDQGAIPEAKTHEQPITGKAEEAVRGWLFGVAGYRLWLYGKSAMRHELFHAVQDFKDGLFDSQPGLLRCLAAEYSAHLWGGPLLGIPLAYGGTLFIVSGIVWGVCVLVGVV